MANLSITEMQILEKLFQMGSGYVLNFSDRTMGDFFSSFGINIYDEKYKYRSGSKANYLRGFWQQEEDVLVWESILNLVEYIENQILLDNLKESDFKKELIIAWKQIGEKLTVNKKTGTQQITKISETLFSNNTISIILQKEVFNHVRSLLESKHYFNAVEEAYKIVRQKLKSITGEEQAHQAFNVNNYEMIFWHSPQNDAEKDFFEGVKFLHMAIQKLRNEKSHTPAKELNKNLAIHYIVLASLAYDLINRS